MNNNREKDQLIWQGIRGYAALAVLISHVSVFDYLGAFGVSLFICLSGFLTEYYSNSQKKYNIKWMKNKLFNIYPLYFIVTCISAIYFSASMIFEVSQEENLFIFAINLLMLQSFFSEIKYYGAFSQVGWYMSYFLVSILLTPLFIKIWNKLNKLMIPFLLLFFYILTFVLSRNNCGMWLIYICPFYRVIEFFMGGCIAKYIVYKKQDNICERNIGFWLVVAILAVVFITYFSVDSSNLFYYNFVWLLPTWILIGSVALLKNNIIQAIFANRIITFIGDISLEIFLCQLCVIYYLKHLLERWNYIPGACSKIAVVIAVAYGAYCVKFFLQGRGKN